MSLAPITGVVGGNAGHSVNWVAVLSFLIILTLLAIVAVWIKKRPKKHIKAKKAEWGNVY